MMNIGGSLSGIAKVLSQSGAVNGVSQNVLGKLAQGMSQGALNVKGVTAVVSQMLGGKNGALRVSADVATKLRLILLLNQAMEKAKAPGGNPQTQINDLIIKLQALSRDSAAAQSMSQAEQSKELESMVQKRSEMFDMLRQITSKYNETSKSIIQHMGR